MRSVLGGRAGAPDLAHSVVFLTKQESRDAHSLSVTDRPDRATRLRREPALVAGLRAPNKGPAGTPARTALALRVAGSGAAAAEATRRRRRPVARFLPEPRGGPWILLVTRVRGRPTACWGEHGWVRARARERVAVPPNADNPATGALVPRQAARLLRFSFQAFPGELTVGPR
jgi:hypothetical protein